MFLVRNTIRRSSGKVYRTVLLRESYREGKKVKKRTIANISHCTENEINAIESALKFKKNPSYPSEGFNILQGKSIGGIYVLHEIATRIGIVEALGSSFHGKLALWLIIARIIEQGSRLSATRLDGQYDIASVIQLERGFDENNLYNCLHWLSENQESIEDALYKKYVKKYGKKARELFLYDVTSSYFEGQYNELAAFGYNRDGRKRKRIVVVGLLCGDQGTPLSVQGFKGNMQDTQTFQDQILKLKERFKCEDITMICDRGLIREKQKKLLKEHGFHYISALPMPQIYALLNTDSIKLEDFSAELKSLRMDDRRYIYRCNPDRAQQTKQQRQERFDTAQKKIEIENQRLKNSPKASPHIAKKRIQKFLKKLCIFEWVTVNIMKKQLILTTDKAKLAKKSELDGCYIWTTDLSEEEMSDRDIYDRYKDLKYVEEDFRTFKTTFLEIRPIFVRMEESTKGHIFIVMLAHMILRELREKWEQFNKTIQECINELSFLCRNTVQFSNGKIIECIPSPNESMTKLLNAANVKLPRTIEEIKVPVVTRQRVRKNAKI